MHRGSQCVNEELELYKDGDRTSEMDYQIWSEIYALLEVSLVRLHDIGQAEARKQRTWGRSDRNGVT